jgi:hypothetical protein
MRPSKLSLLNDKDIDALYDAVLRAPLAVARLAATMPRDRFAFALAALADTGLLQLEIRDDQIELRAPYAPRSGPVVVRRAVERRSPNRERRRRALAVTSERRRSAIAEAHEELHFDELADELGIDRETLKNNVGSEASRPDRRAQRRR